MDIDKLKQKPEIIDFIATFFRLEYALKASGEFLTKDKNATPDWTTFASEIEYEISNSTNSQLKRSIDYILNNPPQKQINEGGVIKWKRAGPSQQKKTKNLIIYIRRIRNNLFHGGKFVGGYLEELDRDFKLVENALIILKEIVNFNKKVKNAFYG